MRNSSAGGVQLALVALLLAAAPPTAWTAVYSRALTIPNPAGGSQDLFGNAVAALGNDILVGAPFDDTMASNAGAVYRFDGTTGTLVQTYYAPTPVADASFGDSVAVLGSNILVGASFDDVPGQVDAGAAYLIDASTGAALLTFVSPTPILYARFGAPLRAVGGNVAILASSDNPSGPEYGAVYLFDGTTGGFLRKYTSSSVGPLGTGWGQYSLEAFGTNILVGAPFDGTAAPAAGAVFMYDADPASLTFGDLVRTFLSPTPSQEAFGDGLAVHGGTVLISATSNDVADTNSGVLYVFDGATAAHTATIPNPNPAPNQYFGNIVAGVGAEIVVGDAVRDDPPFGFSGIAYRFDAATGTLLQTIPNPTPGDSDFFGNAVAALGDRIVIASAYDGAAAFQAGTVYLYDPCGNGVVTASEQCDDGNVTAGDCCSSTCQFEAPGSSCGDDGNVCTNDVCNPTGACTHPDNTAACDDGNACTVGDSCAGGSCGSGGPLACDPCKVCDTATGCQLPVAPGCQSAFAAKATIAAKDGGADPSQDRLISKWKSSAAVTVADFGDPSTSSGYVLCVIDQQGGQPTLRLSAKAPAGGICGTSACWKATSSGWIYKDSVLAPDGISGLQLKAGGPAQAKVVVKGKGVALGVPTLGLTTPLTVRVQRTDASACWEATYSTAIRNDTVQLKAKSD